MAINELQRAVGIFSNRRDAEDALYELRDAGFNMDKVSVVVQNTNRNDRIADAGATTTTADQVKGGATAGAAAGATAGGIIGLVGSLGVLAIPGVGAAAEVGFLLGNALLGGAIGAAGGGLIGALVGWGVPEDRATYYNERVTQGDYLVVVEGSPADIRIAEAILHNRGIRDWGIYPAPGVSVNPRMGMI